MTLKTTGFLRDIDDEHLYAQQLEHAWVMLGAELSEIIARFPVVADGICFDQERHDPGDMLRIMAERYSELCTMRRTMQLLARDMADRAGRLADAAVGLPDRVLHEQSTQGEARSAGDRGD